jgi:hypothetical protein
MPIDLQSLLEKSRMGGAWAMGAMFGSMIRDVQDQDMLSFDERVLGL